MVQPSWLIALQELKAIPTPETTLQCLRRIKNDIIGHEQRKELVVKYGVLEPLTEILESCVKASGKKSTQQINGSGFGTKNYDVHWGIEDEIRLQATLIVGSLANGGPAFVSPIFNSKALPLLLSALSPDHVPSRVIIASLRSLNNIATARFSLKLTHDHVPSCHTIYTQESLENFVALLQQQPSSLVAQQQVLYTANLIALTCQDDDTGEKLVKAGVVDALASHIAMFAAPQGHSMHVPNTLHSNERRLQLILRGVMRAIAAIAGGSAYRAYRFILSPSLRKVFSTPIRRALLDTNPLVIRSSISGHAGRPNDALPLGQLLPKVLAPQSKSVSFGSQSFPALASLASSRYGMEQSGGDVGVSSPLFVWLLHTARTQYGTTRLAALRLLARVNVALNANQGVPNSDTLNRVREKERQMALLAIPLAVKLVQEAAGAMPETCQDPSEFLEIQEDACLVLAELIHNMPELQKTAFEAKSCVQSIAQILRKSFDPVTLARPTWSAQTQGWGHAPDSGPSSTLGDPGLLPEIAHAMKCRQGALEALAGIAEREDAHRKAIVDSGIIQFLIDSLTPLPKSVAPFSSSGRNQITSPKDGNTIPVLIAACHAARYIARSVALLRTSLIDVGIAKPIFTLLQHPNNAVKVAATDVSCNLVLEFSPMRQDFISAGAVRTLCDHATQSDPELRRASLWALKHLVLNAPLDMKIACLEELGTGWLIQAIQGEQRSDMQASPTLGMGTPNAVGEQVDLLNAPESPDMDLDLSEDEQADDEDGDIMYDQNGNGTRYQSSGIRTTLKPVNMRSQLRLLRENEQSPYLRARREDIVVQEQALDFIRNFMNGDDSAQAIDHILSPATIGANRLFELIISKLKPTIQYSPGQTPARHVPGSQSRSMFQPQEIIFAAIQIIVHIAAGAARHKQLLIAQKHLLSAMLPHFNSPDRKIRVICVWAVSNLTWEEDSTDRENARARAHELRALGIEDKVKGLAHDSDLDVRERTKTAMKQFDMAFDGGNRHR